jgi:hypothetical protein
MTQVIGRKSPFKTVDEMKRIQEADAKLKIAQAAKLAPQTHKVKPLAYFEIGRYVEGTFTGLFVVSQLITEGPDGKLLKKPLKKIVADGVDIHVANTAIETALRKRVFR